MAATSSLSPSNDDHLSSSHNTVAKKDKACPFCAQPFTSSSLGRHLDLYIKPVNPKPPDGIHDVEEIRKIRSAITRRHPKGSKQHRERRHSADSDHDAPPSILPRSPPPAPAAQYLQNHASIPQATGRPLSDIYKLQWTATGVINNIPSRDTRNSGSPHQQPALKSPASVPAATTFQAAPNAADLALREILQQVSLAQARLKQSKIFNFDFSTCTFPTLVLKLLKPPPASFENLPYHVRDFWPRDTVPGRDCYDNLRAKVEARVRDAHSKLQTLARGEQTDGSKLDEDLRRYCTHLDAVFAEWSASSNSEAVWRVAIINEIRIEREERIRIEERCENLVVENERLRAELAAVSGGSVAALRTVAASLAPPNVSISDEVAQELARGGFDAGSWNYEALVGKYHGILGPEAAAGSASTPGTAAASVASPGVSNGYPTTRGNGFATKRPADAPLGARPAPHSRAIRYDDEEDEDEDGQDTGDGRGEPDGGMRGIG